MILNFSGIDSIADLILICHQKNNFSSRSSLSLIMRVCGYLSLACMCGFLSCLLSPLPLWSTSDIYSIPTFPQRIHSLAHFCWFEVWKSLPTFLKIISKVACELLLLPYLPLSRGIFDTWTPREGNVLLMLFSVFQFPFSRFILQQFSSIFVLP